MRWLVAVLAGARLAVSAVTAEEAPRPDPEREVVRKVAPTYPDLARRTNLSGVVKLVVVVSPKGSVKSSEPKGGNPVLIVAAAAAAKEWKFAAGQQGNATGNRI